MAAPQQVAEPEAQELELELELQAVIGFNGYIYAGLTCHPDREHLIYPLGCTVVIESLNNSQSFLHGHTNNVSCVAVSPSGRYIASGQVTFMGFKICACMNSIVMCVSFGYSGTIRVWELDLPNRKIRSTECQTGQLKRVITCIMMADDDSYFYVGTTSGDILKLNTKSKLMSDYGPMKDKFSLV
ncbi:cilia- and flagella-associated protein 52 isoform B [Alligator mississippiensis]|nr:cilia- and flagella-associated protein 52 isoform B [Alligator mississippiensis]